MITEAYSNMLPHGDLERELNMYRSGSAPPTVEGAVAAFGGLLGDSGDKIGAIGFVSEEELRADSAYANYYYSNVKLNPRLPPPLVSKEDWRFTQRLNGGTRGGGVSDRPVGRSGAGEGSLFSVQPGLNGCEWSVDGLIGLPMPGLGSRQKSIAETLQADMNHGAAASVHQSRPTSRSAFSESLDFPEHFDSPNPISSTKGTIGSSVSQTYASALGVGASLSRSNTPDPQLVDRVPTPRIPTAVVGGVNSMDKRSINGQNSFHGVSESEEDIVAALSGLNLASNVLLDEENNLYGNKEFQKPSVISPNNSSFMKEPSSTNRHHNYGMNGSVPTSLPPTPFENFATGSSLGLNGMDPRSLGGNPSLSPNLMAAAAELHNISQAGNHTAVPVAGAFQYSRSNELHDLVVDRHGMGNTYANLLELQKAYYDALLLSQKSQYGFPFLGESGGFVNNGYDNIKFGRAMGMSYSGSPPFPNSPVRQSERNIRHQSGTRNFNGGVFAGWNMDNCVGLEENFIPSLLDEFKSNKAKCFELSEIAGHVVEFSADQYGSRFIQQKLETASTEEKDMVFHEIMPRALTLMTDVFGNYVIQKFFEHGSPSQVRELAEQLYGHVLTLSLQMYGCRVIQKVIEVVELDQQTKMAMELDGHVMRCVRDQNGNHVIQKCIECIPEESIHFIVSVFYDQVVTLSTHPYGCRVIQRILEHCHDPQTQQIMIDEIMQSVCMLAQDQYGNYVVQHVLEHGKPHERTEIIKTLTGKIVHMSQQKFASNVIEKCLTFGTPMERQILVNEMLGSSDENDPLQVMMKDQFANYVVQKVLETCDDHQLEVILNRIKIHLTTLKRYTYGKHIVARVEKLVAAGERRISILNPHPA
ncbi:hypothetical protein SAY87_006150 [Trapa incisa]|uniref:PUM-HD domain-containing protein n=1 Tax=Trapa incisa TaxID=236973 RepID=A0AAN7KC98_9MYRT|nr:hypothetical protein SAY87_006150 [Trapa incisa]